MINMQTTLMLREKNTAVIYKTKTKALLIFSDALESYLIIFSLSN